MYSLDQGQIANGELKQVGARPHALKLGGTWTLDDGTKLEFLGTRPFDHRWRSATTPPRRWCWAARSLGLLGLMLSLCGHRRRIWFRASPPTRGRPAVP